MSSTCSRRSSRLIDRSRPTGLPPDPRDNAMRPTTARFPARRRGVTLIEMLVTVGLLVLIMSVIVSIFSAATGSITAQRTYATLDQDLRRVESIMRRDLVGQDGKGGSPPRWTPPIRPTRPRAGATSSTARTPWPTSRARTPTTTSPSPPRPPTASRSPAPSSCRSTTRTTSPPSSASSTGFPSPAIMPRSSIFLRNGNLYRRVFLILPKEWENPLSKGVGRSARA